MEQLETYIVQIATGIEFAGVLTIVIGAFLALVRYVFLHRKTGQGAYKLLRQDLGKAILLGLEILVAADIIATVVTKPTLQDVLALGLIVLIRTFLSFSLEIEITGRLPWKESRNTAQQPESGKTA